MSNKFILGPFTITPREVRKDIRDDDRYELTIRFDIGRDWRGDAETQGSLKSLIKKFVDAFKKGKLPGTTWIRDNDDNGVEGTAYFPTKALAEAAERQYKAVIPTLTQDRITIDDGKSLTL